MTNLAFLTRFASRASFQRTGHLQRVQDARNGYPIPRLKRRPIHILIINNTMGPGVPPSHPAPRANDGLVHSERVYVPLLLLLLLSYFLF